jgi:hypothetical protein
MTNHIRYGTNDKVEIRLLQYGFGYEEIEWIKPLIEGIDKRSIRFNPSINELEMNRKALIDRYA